jgi:putative ABC transport system substrate-binding protein
MKRREFITLLGGAAALPLAARAQQRPMPVVGFLSSQSPGPATHLVAAFRQGLKEGGFVDGQSVTIETRFAEGRYDQLPALVTELLGRQVAAIVASGPQASFAAKAATATVPIVFVVAIDPVTSGLVSSLNHPGGNVTGVTFMARALAAKRLELFREMIPNVGAIAMLVNPSNPTAENDIKEFQAAASMLGLHVDIQYASTESDIADILSDSAKPRPALFVSGDPFFFSHRDQIAVLAARHSIPASYDRREFVEAGGLMSYGTASFAEAYRQAGIYTVRILKGEKPAELPVMQPTKFELVINLKAAKALGLQIPDKLLALADEVIE